MDEWILSTGGELKPDPVSLCPPKIQHGLALDWTQASVVTDHQQTTLAMVQLDIYI